MFGHEWNIIGVWTKCGDRSVQAGGSIKCMIVIKTDVRDAFLPENAYHAVGQGSFA